MKLPPPGSGALVVRGGAPVDWATIARAGGWTVVDAAEVPDEPWSLHGTIVCVIDLATAGLVLARSGSVAVMHLEPAELERLLPDAVRVGAQVWPSADDPSESASPRTGNLVDRPTVDAETAALLDTLVTGTSVIEAAQLHHMSLRTAQRRLAAARDAFGVPTTSGAVAAWSRRQGLRS